MWHFDPLEYAGVLQALVQLSYLQDFSIAFFWPAFYLSWWILPPQAASILATW
jgi:hypothetical protein